MDAKVEGPSTQLLLFAKRWVDSRLASMSFVFTEDTLQYISKTPKSARVRANHWQVGPPTKEESLAFLKANTEDVTDKDLRKWLRHSGNLFPHLQQMIEFNGLFFSLSYLTS